MVEILSIVAVKSSPTDDLRRFLRAILTFCSEDVEVIVVSNDSVRFRRMNRLQLLVRPGASVAELRGIGAAAARGTLVAFLDVSSRVYPGWEAAIRRALVSNEAVTGPVAYSGGRSLVTWAAFLAEYALLLPGVIREGSVSGCNLAVRQSALFSVFTPREAVYKPELVDRLRQREVAFAMVDDSVVAQRKPETFARFYGDRIEQGRGYARYRSRSMARFERTLRSLGFPITWLVLVARVAVSFRARPGLLPAAAPALPIAGCFLFAWSLGEARGYLEK